MVAVRPCLSSGSLSSPLLHPSDACSDWSNRRRKGLDISRDLLVVPLAPRGQLDGLETGNHDSSAQLDPGNIEIDASEVFQSIPHIEVQFA